MRARDDLDDRVPVVELAGEVEQQALDGEAGTNRAPLGAIGTEGLAFDELEPGDRGQLGLEKLLDDGVAEPEAGGLGVQEAHALQHGVERAAGAAGALDGLVDPAFRSELMALGHPCDGGGDPGVALQEGQGALVQVQRPSAVLGVQDERSFLLVERQHLQ